MMWLEGNDELSMEYLYNAIEKDKKDGVSFITDPPLAPLLEK